jgi:hypothetical protein
MKLHVDMCMKLERHNFFNFFWKDTKIPKDILKIKIFFSFQYFKIHKDVLKITTCNMFIFQKFQFGINL